MTLWRTLCGTALAGALLAAPTPVRAQDTGDKGKPEAPKDGEKPNGGGRRGGPQRGPYDAEELKQKLGLTDEVKGKIAAAIDEFRTTMREKLKDVTDRDARRAAMKELREALDKKIEALLDDGQKAKFAELKKEAAARGRGRGPGGGEGDGGGRPPKKDDGKGDGGKPGEPKPDEPH